MEYEEIKKLTDAELAEKISGERIMLGKLKLQHGVSPIENPMRVRSQRKLVARLLTELNDRKHNAGAPNNVAEKKESQKPEAKTKTKAKSK